MYRAENPLNKQSMRPSQHYIEQKVSNLQFGLYSYRFDPNLFEIFRQTQLQRRGYQAEFWIIGSSHVVNIQTETVEIAEVISAAKTGLPTDGRIRLVDPFRSGCYQHSADLRYHVNLELNRYDNRELFINQSQPPVDKQIYRLQQTFPSYNGDHPPPTTTIDILRADGEQLAFRTLHTYTEELALAITRTEIQFT